MKKDDWNFDVEPVVVVVTDGGLFLTVDVVEGTMEGGGDVEDGATAVVVAVVDDDAEATGLFI